MRKRRIGGYLNLDDEGGRQVVLCAEKEEHLQKRGVLLRLDRKGVWVFCKHCHEEHVFDWDALFALRLEMDGRGGNDGASG